MPFGKIIEDANGVSFIEEQFGADAADVARASDHENSHRARCRATACRSKQTALPFPSATWERGARCCRSDCLLFQSGNHPPDQAISSTRFQNLEALFL